MNLTKQQQYLIQNQGGKALIINVFANAAIGWLILKEHSALTLWGDTGIGLDLLATAFLLPFLSCLILSPILSKQIREGKVEALEPEQIEEKGWHLRPVFIRGIFLDLLGVLLAAAPILLIFKLSGILPIGLWTYVWFKGIWAGLLAGIVTPFIAYWVMGSVKHKTEVPN